MEAGAHNDRAVQWLLAFLICLYVLASVLPFVLPRLPSLVVISAQILVPALFVFIHGWRVYGFRGMLAFTCISFAIGNIFENLGTRTGFPFGSYYFTDVMGPKLLGVPLLMGPAYLAIGYTSWLIAHVILSPVEEIRPRLLFTPLLAACIAVSWDLAAEPRWSTLTHFWIWQRGGVYFGAPFTNFLGWFLTNYLIFQLFGIYLSRQTLSRRVPAVWWRLGTISYLAVIMASVGTAGILFFTAGHVSDATGRQWNIPLIALTSASISVFLMGGFGASAMWKLTRPVAKRTDEAPAMLKRKAAGD